MIKPVLAAFLFASAAHAAAGVGSRKPRMNGWLALYDIAGRKGAVYTVVVPPIKRLTTVHCDVHVPTSAPGMPSGDTCELRCSLCPHCENIPGFDPGAFALDYDDKGCTGKLRNLRFVPSAVDPGGFTDLRGVKTGADGLDSSPEAFQRYMRRFLTPAVFDYLGLLYLQDFRDKLHTD